MTYMVLEQHGLNKDTAHQQISEYFQLQVATKEHGMTRRMLTSNSEEVCAQAVKGPELKQLVGEDQLPRGHGNVPEHAQRYRLSSPQPWRIAAAQDLSLELCYPVAL